MAICKSCKGDEHNLCRKSFIVGEGEPHGGIYRKGIKIDGKKHEADCQCVCRGRQDYVPPAPLPEREFARIPSRLERPKWARELWAEEQRKSEWLQPPDPRMTDAMRRDAIRIARLQEARERRGESGRRRPGRR